MRNREVLRPLNDCTKTSVFRIAFALRVLLRGPTPWAVYEPSLVTPCWVTHDDYETEHVLKHCGRDKAFRLLHMSGAYAA